MKRHYRASLALGISVLELILSGCSPVKLPELHTYTLAPTHPFVQVRHKHTRRQSVNVIYVATPNANPGYQSSNMLYMTEPYQLSAFGQSQWAAPPALMLQGLVADALRARGYFDAVLTHAQGAQWQYRLNVTLVQLQQEFMGPQSRVRLELLANLVDVEHGGQVIASKRFMALERAYAPNPYAGVLAANRAATHLVSEIANFCVKNVQR
jgi:cholesterol transport system auxiliary component